jgi:hypothetical protein
MSLEMHYYFHWFYLYGYISQPIKCQYNSCVR